MSSPDILARAIGDFLAVAPHSVVLEDGAPVFDFAAGARCSLSSEHGKCVLHLWSPERNSVRRVLDAELKHGNLRLTVQRFGQAKPAKLELCCDRDRRSPSARQAARRAYQQRLRGVLERQWPGWTLDRLTIGMDLERSFGPTCTRGLMRQGRSAFAFVGINAQEPQAAIDAALTFGILWLDLCRERHAARCHVEGLRLFLPAGTSQVVRARMAHLYRAAAKWQLFELEEHEGLLTEFDTADCGNMSTRLVFCPNPVAARARFAALIARVTALVPQAEIVVLSDAELSFRLHGLEFARAQLAAEPGSFRPVEQIVFGAGPRETVLSDVTAPLFTELAQELRKARHPDGLRHHPLFRMCPERWLESMVVRDVSAIDDRLDPACVYSQVPAFAASDRGMIDVLTATRDGRLAIVELKADEDIHLPLQGLDYWARVQWHHARGEFPRFGYFSHAAGVPLNHGTSPVLPLAGGPPYSPQAKGWDVNPGYADLSADSPILLLVAPALHVHPATDTLLRYLSPAIDCTLVAIDERWRSDLRVIFRKRPAARAIGAATT